MRRFLTRPLARAALALLISLAAVLAISWLRLVGAEPLTVVLVAFAASTLIFAGVLRDAPTTAPAPRA